MVSRQLQAYRSGWKLVCKHGDHISRHAQVLQVYTHCPSIINSTPFHSQAYADLDNKLYGYPISRPHPLDDEVVGNKALCIAWQIITQHPRLLVALNRVLSTRLSTVCLTVFLESHNHTHKHKRTQRPSCCCFRNLPSSFLGWELCKMYPLT